MLFDIIGPVMIGPSSSHTAGAVRIGKVSRKLLGEPVKKAEILLHGSFARTGKGHGTDRGLVAGLLGMNVDDSRIPDSLKIAEKSGLAFEIGETDLGEEAHPNSVRLLLTGVTGRTLDIVASSIGGGQIMVNKIDGITVNFSGECPTLIVHNMDQPGHVAEVTSMLQHKSVNIAAMHLYRNSRGGSAVMVLECDQEIPADGLAWLSRLEGVVKVTYLSLQDPESKDEQGV